MDFKTAFQEIHGSTGAHKFLASKTAAKGTEAKQFAEFLNLVCGEIAATFTSAFKVTHRPLLNQTPGMGEIYLDKIDQESLSQNNGIQGSRVKSLISKLNDGEIKEIINNAWAQSAVWHNGEDGGFVYEVFVRPETLDTTSLVMKYKFVTGTKE